MSKPIESGPSVLRDLNAKFCNNLGLALAHEEPLASKAELQARAIPVVAKILGRHLELAAWQRDALCMFDEIFADVICSIYLSACGLDKPAHMILRRSLEVGAATVYVWDLPHLFWAWRDHDKDLTFNEMLDHFSAQGFNSFVRSQNPHYRGTGIIDATLARALYRKLSNIIHGKMTTFESVLPDKFEYSQHDWRSHLEQVCEVEKILLKLWENRFCCVSDHLLNEFPQLRMQRINENDAQV
jgi:hypothetical protein